MFNQVAPQQPAAPYLHFLSSPLNSAPILAVGCPGIVAGTGGDEDSANQVPGDAGGVGGPPGCRGGIPRERIDDLASSMIPMLESEQNRAISHTGSAFSACSPHGLNAVTYGC